MRKGFSLVEMVVVMVVVVALLVPLAGLSTTTIRDIPQFYRTIQTNTTVLNMLKQMHRDINAAAQLPKSFAGFATDDKLLLIELTDGVICYQLKDHKVLRRTLTSQSKTTDDHTTVWPVPNAEILWKVWRKNDTGYAVEVNTCIGRKTPGRLEKRMANSYLYFVGAYKTALN